MLHYSFLSHRRKSDFFVDLFVRIRFYLHKMVIKKYKFAVACAVLCVCLCCAALHLPGVVCVSMQVPIYPDLRIVLFYFCFLCFFFVSFVGATRNNSNLSDTKAKRWNRFR